MKALLSILSLLLASCQGSNSLGTSGSGLISETAPDPVVFEAGEDFDLTIDTGSEFSTLTLSNLTNDTSSLALEGSVILETGRFNITNTIDNSSEHALSFRNSFVDPIVILHITTNNDTETVAVRGRSISSTGISAFLQDPSNGSHGTETIAYVVLEAGEHELGNGVNLEGAHFSTTDNHNASESFASPNVTLGLSYGSAPNVFSTLNSYNNADYKASLVSDVSTTNFAVQQSSTDSGTSTVLEDIAWIAASSFTGSIQGQNFEIKSGTASGNTGIDDGTPETFSFSSFSSSPDIISDGRTDNGADGYFARGSGLWSSTQYGVYAWEDIIGDSERGHTNEDFSVFAADPNSQITKYETSASFESPSYDISNIESYQSSSISFSVTTGSGVGFDMQYSISSDGGSSFGSWQSISSGGEITDLSSVSDFSNHQIRVRGVVTSTNNLSTFSLSDFQIQILNN